jgi:hypothetical protein
MKAEEPFFIGWQPEVPPKEGRMMRKLAVLILLLAPILGAVVVFSQKPFSEAVFEFGKISRIEGILYPNPVPMLRVKNGSGQLGPETEKSLILLGAGKFGAQKALKKLSAMYPDDPGPWKVTIEGKLVYYDGKALLELSRDAASIVASQPADLLSGERESISLGHAKLEGEIIDPKCFFGVMKPGEGKVHRSCAVRCISGGIPPVFRVRNAAGESQYLLLTGVSGQPIHEAVLPFVGKPVSVEGEVARLDDWLILKTDPKSGIQAEKG